MPFTVLGLGEECEQEDTEEEEEDEETSEDSETSDDSSDSTGGGETGLSRIRGGRARFSVGNLGAARLGCRDGLVCASVAIDRRECRNTSNGTAGRWTVKLSARAETIVTCALESGVNLRLYIII